MARFKNGDEKYDDESKTQFTSIYCLMEDASLVMDIGNFSFLKYLEAAPKKEYLYAIWETEVNIVKIGKSSKPWKRLKSHVDGFEKYAGANRKNIRILLSRRTVSVFDELEKYLLNAFSYSEFVCGYIGNEYFKIHSNADKDKIQKSLIDLFSSDKMIWRDSIPEIL